MEGVESAEEGGEKAVNKGISKELDRLWLSEPIEPIGPVLSHDFAIIVITTNLNDFLTIDELQQMRDKEKEESTKRTLG